MSRVSQSRVGDWRDMDMATICKAVAGEVDSSDASPHLSSTRNCTTHLIFGVKGYTHHPKRYIGTASDE